ncbi:DUF5979 domain-containing protein [Demequina aurantiaca]|uniref:DUF5979 domain-containing protein n=1 Tax=Demequina aurantiaca TaxID=676200 RepID=UPI003D344E17
MKIATSARAFTAALLVSVLALASAFVAAPAMAAQGDPQYLSVTKAVDKPTPAPGEEFTYQIDVNCSEASCLDAQLRDPLPAELDGFQLVSAAYNPSAATVPRNVTWDVGGTVTSTQPTVVTADTTLIVDFTGDVAAPSGIGLSNGRTFTVTLKLKVPAQMPVGTVTADNTAYTTATNSKDDQATATVKVTVAETVSVGLAKTWKPSPQSFVVDSASTVALKATNTSNIAANTLVVQEPSVAAANATTLTSNNPFVITDFTGLTSSMPTGATAVRVDAYVFTAGTPGTWNWVSGTAGATPVLPAGVAAGDVGGLRLTYTGTIAPSAAADVSVGLKQRATHRNTGVDLSKASHSVTNIASATLTATGHNPVSTTANAPYTVNPAKVAAGASKSISPSTIAAGDTAVATLVGTNTSDVGVNTLQLSDLGYFTDKVTFGGFTTPPTWPATAASAAVIFHPLAGGADVTVPFLETETPATPAFKISGFDIVYTSADGAIASASSATAKFKINSTESAIVTGTTLLTTNSVDVKVIAPNGNEASAKAFANLTLVTPAIKVTLSKSVLPSAVVQPGDRVVTKLVSKLTTTSDYVTAKQIIVEDSFGVRPATSNKFWNAFNLQSIPGTQIPANSSLKVEARDAAGNWLTIGSFPASTSPQQVELTSAQITAELAGTGTALNDVTGVRFTFDNATGFADNTTVTPYVVSTARSTLRSGGNVTTTPGTAVQYRNDASTKGSGATVPGTPVQGTASANSSASIVTYSGGGGPGGTVGIDKQWAQTTVSAQSGATPSTNLNWKVTEGFGQVTITDPIDSTNVAATVFNAFDLRVISAISSSSSPFSNGWYLKYDTITAVELFNGTTWTAVSVPTGGWINSSGRFVGHTLTTAQTASTTGVRVTLVENTAARQAAQTEGSSFDPYAPLPGTGVGASSPNRTFNLGWTLRDKTRVGNNFVTGNMVYNATDKGLVSNSVLLAAGPVGGTPTKNATDNDTILLLDGVPGVTVAKTVDPTTVRYVPIEGSSASSYPTFKYTVTAKSNSVSRASYVRVMDPPVCTSEDTDDVCEGPSTTPLADPFSAAPGTDWLTDDARGNPFDRMNLEKVAISASIANQVDLTKSVVWLLRYNGGVYTTTQSTATAVNAMSDADLADVVGISVTFQGTDPATTGGTITSANNLKVELSTRVRTTFRVSGEPQVLKANDKVDVPNRVFAQSYDPILAPATQTGDVDTATAKLTGGDINVGVTKSVSPSALTEPTRDDEVTVTLVANQGTSPVSSLSPAEVRLTDDTTTSPDFWNEFDFSGLGTITAPAGADRVTVSVYGPYGTAGAYQWKDSAVTSIANATVPVPEADYDQIEGLRLVFTKDGGGFFSPDDSKPTWTTTSKFTVQLRDTYRDDAEKVILSGSVDNTVTAISIRSADESSVERSASAQIGLSLGTFEIKVNKLANNGVHSMNAGEEAPWDLTFTNSGTGFLTIDELRDVLPASLVYLGSEDPIYTADPAGMLPEPESFTIDGTDLVFTWPQGDRTMAPGESFSIRIQLELQPGLTSGQRATNEFTVNTAQTLESCGNIQSGGSTTDAFGNDPTTCGTTDYVTPNVGPNLYTVKGVRGAVSGATVPILPGFVCQQSLSATGGQYYRSPCLANSVIGGTDDWVLRTQNAGTTGVTELTVFDALPAPGDTFYISGTNRGSSYRPELTAAPLVTAPAGATVVFEITTSASPCVGTWSDLANHPVCEQNGEEWTVADSATDWSTITGLRIAVSFENSQAGMLAPGQFVDVTYQTVNLPATDENTEGAGTKVPAFDSYAWNQFGVKYLDTTSQAFKKIAPARVGVHLAVGAISVAKDLTGPATQYAPADFLMDVSCTIEGVGLDLGDQAVVTLNADNIYSHRIDGIPLGSVCDVSEQGDVGEFGETSRTGDRAEVTVDTAVAVGGNIPVAQSVEIGNDYQFSGMSVTKTVQSEVSGAVFGPFDYSLGCTTSLGQTVLFADDQPRQLFSLVDGGTYAAPENAIPVGSTCVVTEVDSASADSVTISGPGVTDNGDGSASVAVGPQGGEEPEVVATFTNGFDSTMMTVSKALAGPGKEFETDTSFDFTVQCVFNDSVLLDQEFSLIAGAEQAFGPLPAGTDCDVTETGTGGAKSTEWTTSVDGVEQGSGTGTGAEVSILGTVNPVDLMFTNNFAATLVKVSKELAGPGAESQTKTGFDFSIQCVYNDSVLLDQEFTLVAGTDQSFGPLPIGADCSVTETGTGDAASTSWLVAVDGVEQGSGTGTGASAAVTDTTTSVDVTLTNRFNTPESGAGSDGGLSLTGPEGIAAMALAALALMALGFLMVISRRRRGDV